MKNNLLKNKSGFTLLEMMIAISLFTVVMLISSNMFLRSIDSQARSVNSKGIQESLGFALAVMSKEMSGALANPTSCDSNCVDTREFFCVTESGGSLFFRNANGECVSYNRIQSGTTLAHMIGAARGSIGYTALTPNNISITRMDFSSVYTHDATYPIAQVTVSIQGQSLINTNHPDTVTMQTTVSIGQ